MIGAGEAPRYLDLAARWLGALHGSRLALDRSFDLANELANLGEWAGLIGRTHWGEGRAAAAIVARLRARASGLRLETRVPIHKDFHYEHIVVGDRLTAIDFDEARLGDPAFDVAHFCAYLDLLAHRLGSAAQGRALTGVFLDAYARQTGWTPDERFGFFYAYTCVKIGKQLCTTRGPRPWPAGRERRRQVRLMLERGLAALAPELAAGGLA
jgi:aminoglycoside phosphotransferase (APT) family kinase protein